MRRNNSLLGLIGLILLLFAAVAGVLTRARTGFDLLYIFINGLFGLFAVIAYLSAGLEHGRVGRTHKQRVGARDRPAARAGLDCRRFRKSRCASRRAAARS